MTALRLSYQTIEFGKTDIHLCTLRNRQEYSDPDGAAEKAGICSSAWPIFGVVWPSSLVLAHFVNDYGIKKQKVLEVGCGIALTSLLLNKQSTDITATDYHPEVGTFLSRNTALNNDSPIKYEQVDWANDNEKLGLFDLIIGSDLLYEDNHIKLLANFINKHAKPDCEVIIVDPGRGRKTKFSKILETNGFHSTHIKPEHTQYLDAPFKGYVLCFSRNSKTPELALA